MPGGGGLSLSLKVVLTSYREEAGSSALTMSSVAQLARLVLPLDNPATLGRQTPRKGATCVPRVGAPTRSRGNRLARGHSIAHPGPMDSRVRRHQR